MGIIFNNVAVLHERRVRLVFSQTLAAITSLSYFAVSCLNGQGANPTVLAAIPIPSQGDTLDLVLSVNLASGGSYSVSAVGVPAADSSVTPAGSSATFFFGVAPDDSNAEVQTIDLDGIIFGTDLVWTGSDFLEAPNNDLATLEGIANFEAAMLRRLTSQSVLLWAPKWGLQGGDTVNNPSVMATAFKGRIVRQINADDRTGPGSTVSLQPSTTDPTAQNYVCNIVPKGANDAKPVVAVVPVG